MDYIVMLSWVGKVFEFCHSFGFWGRILHRMTERMHLSVQEQTTTAIQLIFPLEAYSLLGIFQSIYRIHP